MSEQEVKYTMSLQDLLSGKIKEADGHIQHMEGSLHHAASEAKNMGLEIVGALGIGFGIFKGIQLIEEGMHAMHEFEQSAAQVRAGLASTGEAAGLGFEELEEQAKKLAMALPYSRAQIMDMQAQLLTFPSVAKETFGEASQAILDMASRTHRGTNEIAIMVGKALQDPTKGVTALRRVGVNFNAAQTEVIKKLAETGQAGKAQSLILKELNLEFAGSAQAAADADPLFRYNKLMGSIKMEVGEVAVQLLKHLTPALEWFAHAIKDTIHWMKEHKGLILAVGVAVGTMAAGWLIYQGVIGFAAAKTAVMTAAQWLLNIAMDANPIGILIVAIGLLAGAVVYMYNKFDWFRGGVYAAWAALKGLWTFIKEVLISTFTGLGKIIHGVFTMNWTEIKAGWALAVDGAAKAGLEYGKKIMEGYKEGVASMAENPLEKAIAGPKAVGKGKVTKGDAGADGKSETGKATGTKNTTIHITIGNLVKEFKVQTTNISDGATKIKEAVAQALLSAVNDSQVLAGQ